MSASQADAGQGARISGYFCAMCSDETSRNWRNLLISSETDGSHVDKCFFRSYCVCRLKDRTNLLVTGVAAMQAQSDALRVCGDAANPARQESRSVRRRTVNKSPALSHPRQQCAVVPPGMRADVTGIQCSHWHGKPKYRAKTASGSYHGKGGIGGHRPAVLYGMKRTKAA